ncbi:holo-ACP synthase [Nitrosopumilus adriaticus]|uniref:4'-phosphopantetheinyl transferase n=1 Tax=Nitrosopumilus adriaticus TaxID=1580092 RepID=A0A0D5C5J9_9ARCH|nr:4'-phosphopantetheinyl transferase superfamily protein [Nitrosopumilus adriaticus]AJW71798.1 4'-phosphopantetheinyl transferase [Nitrosopumilus adriaticus]
MIEKIGIGIDIIEIHRFNEKPYENNENFYKKIFHNSEIEYCLNNNNSSQSFAAKFAIKESVIKSINEKIEFLDIMTEHQDSKPTVSLLNNLSYNFLVSVSHEKNNAVAVVVSEKR